jgi:hypothetical protein
MPGSTLPTFSQDSGDSPGLLRALLVLPGVFVPFAGDFGTVRRGFPLRGLPLLRGRFTLTSVGLSSRGTFPRGMPDPYAPIRSGLLSDRTTGLEGFA